MHHLQLHVNHMSCFPQVIVLLLITNILVVIGTVLRTEAFILTTIIYPVHMCMYLCIYVWLPYCIYGKILEWENLINLVNKSHSLIFPAAISFYIESAMQLAHYSQYLPSTWFRLAHSPIFYPSKYFPHTMHIYFGKPVDFHIPYNANCSRWKSFAVARSSCYSWENFS